MPEKFIIEVCFAEGGLPRGLVEIEGATLGAGVAVKVNIEQDAGDRVVLEYAGEYEARGST
jgi:hypothetical protein